MFAHAQLTFLGGVYRQSPLPALLIPHVSAPARGFAVLGGRPDYRATSTMVARRPTINQPPPLSPQIDQAACALTHTMTVLHEVKKVLVTGGGHFIGPDSEGNDQYEFLKNAELLVPGNDD